MRQRTLRLGILLAIVGAALCASGCQNRHHENMRLAEARWARARAAVMLQLAEQQYKAGRLDKALRTVGEALQLDPGFPRLQVLRGQILAEKGQGQAAVAAFRMAIAMDPASPDAHYHCGVQLERWGQFHRALEHYALAHEQEPSNVCHVVAMAEVLGHLDRTDAALELIDRTLGVQEQSVALRVTAGELCLARSDYARASGYFRDAARLATGETAVLRSLAMSLYHAGRHDEARGYLEQLVSQASREQSASAGQDAADDPSGAEAPPVSAGGRAELLAALGDCYLTGGQPGKARLCFAEGARLCPSQSGAWENLGKVALYRGRWNEAIEAADKAVALKPDSALAHLIRGYSLSQQDRPAEAVPAFQTAHTLAPRDVLTLCLLSESYRRIGHNRAARETLIRALQIAPTDPLAGRMMDELARADFGRPGKPDQPGPQGQPVSEEAADTVTAGVVVP